MKESLKQVNNMLELFLNRYYKRPFTAYQKQIAEAIIRAVLKGGGEEIFIEVARQAGKTTAVVDTIAFLLLFVHHFFSTPISIGIFAPQKEQAKTDFDRLKTNLKILKERFNFHFEETNGTTIKLSNGNTVYCFSLAPTSHLESKSLHLAIIEEAQKIDDEKAKNEVFPMLASTDGSKIFIGSAGYQLCNFYKGIENGENVYKYDHEKVIADKEKLYKKTKNKFHKKYKTFIAKEKERYREDSDYFQTQYALNWKIGRGMLTTQSELEKLKATYKVETPYKKPVYAGWDVAKEEDESVITVVGWDEEAKKFRILEWLAMQGDDYTDQVEIAKKMLEKYPRLMKVCIDATGVGDPVVDNFKRQTRLYTEPVKFSLQNKDTLYKNLIKILRDGEIQYPAEHKYTPKFETQMLEMIKEYRGEFLSCHHPDKAGAHDDFPDSLALALLKARKVSDVNVSRQDLGL
jgi:phage terminase large subunit-like protein